MSILNAFNLKDKTALVTGCKRGIGFDIAIALAEAGADIIGVSSTLESIGSEVEKAIHALGRKFSAYTCNFSNRESLYQFIGDVKGQHSVIDILVNNAGIIKRAPIEEYSDENWDEVIEINQNAQFILTREIGREMINRGSGKIVFIASLLSFQGGVTVPAYAASKGAIAQLTKAFANEWASYGVNVNAIAPGYILTDNTKSLCKNEERAAQILSRIPAGYWGKPKDIAGPVVFLSSDASSYMQGSIVVVDGGWMGR